MIISWPLHYIPRIFIFLSFTFNPLLIYFILTDTKTLMGKYRYLLIAFSLFDICYSFLEYIAPIGIYGKDAFIIYLADGPFFEDHPHGQLILSIRCGFISLSYGLLVIHFVYRYLVLFNPKLIDEMCKPGGIAGLTFFFFFHGFVWTFICEIFLYSDDEIRHFVYKDFKKTYDADSYKLSMLVSIYRNASFSLIARTLTGIVLLTFVSIYAITVYVVLGYKIMKKLQQNTSISKLTENLHKQLFRALVVQTFIPLIISFFPCMIVWYMPIFKIDSPLNNLFGVISLSAFPFLDPVAIIIFLPNYRNRLLLRKRSTAIRTTSWSRGTPQKSFF